MATLQEMQECIEFIEKMEVLVNYRDESFFKEAKLHKVKKQNYEKSGEPKVQYPFNKIIAKIPEEKRIELENIYKKGKTKAALDADIKMLNIIPNAKEQIAEAFIPFIDEMQKMLELFISNADNALIKDYVFGNEEKAKNNKKTKRIYGVLEKGSSKSGNRKGMHIVYNDLDKVDVVKGTRYYSDGTESTKEDIAQESVPEDNIYQFETLPNLLNIIAKVTTEYCKQMDNSQGIKRSVDVVGERKRGQTTPLFIRKTCAWVCYTLLYFGDTLSKHFKQKPLTTQSGVCSQVMHDLHLRTMYEFEYEYFTGEKKLLEYNKWSMMPEVILRKGNFIAPVSPVSYAGHKSGYLGFMLQSLVNQRTFDTYIEPFGGSGIGIVQFPKKDGIKYYISDGNYANICFYKVLMSNTDFNKFLKKLKEEQEEIKKIYSDFDKYNFSDGYVGRELKNLYRDGYVPTEEDKEFFENWTYKAKKKTYKIFDIDWYINNGFSDSEDTRELFNDVYIMLTYLIKVRRFYIKHFDLYEDVSNMPIGSSELKKFDDKIIDIAVAFVILHTSSMNNVQISVDQSLIRNNRPDFLKLNVDKDLNALQKEFCNIEIPIPEAEYGVSAMDLLKSPKYNKVSTFVYLDSPYICTMEYAKTFDKTMMEDLIDSCKKFKGDFVFSCRINLPEDTMKTLQGKKGGQSKKVSSENKIKFIWFMQQWMGTDYDVLFKVPQEIVTDKGINDIYKYLIECITKPSDLELMICNFKFIEPDYSKFIEKFNNPYKPKDRSVKSDNSVFVQLPIKTIALLVINEYLKL